MKRFGLLVLSLVCLGPDAAAQVTVDMVMSDGVKLKTDIYATNFEPQPVVLLRTPYHRVGFSDVAWWLAASYDVKVFVQDTRGQGDSEGEDTVFRDDPLDGRETLEWIDVLGWSNGVVGTWGASALAITQMLMAPGAHPSYQCQFTIAGTHRIADQVAYLGGVRRTEVNTWLQGQGAWDVIGQWDAHPDSSDAYWEPVVLTSEKAATVHTMGVHTTGWYDIFSQGTLDWFGALQASGGAGAQGNQILVVGPWTHSADSGDIPYEVDPATSPSEAAEAAWVQGCLHKIEGAMKSVAPVNVYVMGVPGDPESPGNDWQVFSVWPPPSNDVLLYLGSEASLHTVAPTALFSPQPYAHDPADPVPTLGGRHLTLPSGPKEQGPIELRSDVAVFTTEPLAEHVEIIGRIWAKLYLTVPADDAQVSVVLSDVYPDGRSYLVATGIQALAPTGESQLVTVDLWSTAQIFAAGHRIRLTVAAASADAFAVTETPYTGQIHRTPSKPSHVLLPVRYGLQNPEPPADVGPEIVAEPPVDLPVAEMPQPDGNGPPDLGSPAAEIDGAGSDSIEDDAPASSGGGSSSGGCGGGPTPPLWGLALLAVVRRRLVP